jgi:hypothetical protein
MQCFIPFFIESAVVIVVIVIIIVVTATLLKTRAITILTCGCGGHTGHG